MTDTDPTTSRNQMIEGYNTIRSRNRCTWTICAGISIMSSKALMIDLNLHYPFHLCLLQLGVGLALAWLCTLCRRPAPAPAPKSRRLTILEWVFLLGLSCLIALSTALTLQAILLFPNVTTIPMLSTISLLAEIVIAFLTSRSHRRLSELIRILALALSCAGILYGEYRLLPRGVLISISVALLTGVSRGLVTLIADNMPDSISHAERLRVLYFCSGFIIVAIGLVQKERSNDFFKALNEKQGSLLIASVLSTAVSMVLGMSVLLPTGILRSHQSAKYRDTERTWDILTLLVLSGSIGLASTSSLRRSYTTRLQIASFFVAILCFSPAILYNSPCNWRESNRGEYTLLTPAVQLCSMGGNNESNTSTEQTDEAQAASAPSSRRIFLTVLVIGLVTPLWIAFLFLNFTEKLNPTRIRKEPTLDNDYIAKFPTEVVISMYKEPVTNVANLISNLRQMVNLGSARFRIYIKDVDANPADIRLRTGAEIIEKLPNVGREGETYLYHILNNYESLARHTVFLQADVHNPREFYPRIRDYFDPTRTGMLSLGFSGNACDCQNCSDRFNWTDTSHTFPSIHGRIYNSTPCTDILLSYKGQFVVSAKRIRGINKEIYHDLREAFFNQSNRAHKQEFWQGEEDSMSNPVFGHTIERIWNLLFQCGGMDVTWKCPTLLSGWRIGGTIADCQCFDE